MVFTTSEAQRYPSTQNIKISLYQVYFHAKMLLTMGAAAENLTTLVTIALVPLSGLTGEIPARAWVITLADLPQESFQDLLSHPWGQAGCQNKRKTSRNSNF